jgi:hypothetical protein
VAIQAYCVPVEAIQACRVPVEVIQAYRVPVASLDLGHAFQAEVDILFQLAHYFAQVCWIVPSVLAHDCLASEMGSQIAGCNSPLVRLVGVGIRRLRPLWELVALDGEDTSEMDKIHDLAVQDGLEV